MPLRCHQSKKEAVLQLCNYLSTQSISHITDLANGEILYRTLQARFPPFGEEVQSSEVDVFRNITESTGIRNENPKNESNPATKEKDIFLQHIKKFIDDRYNIKSENIIEYEKCMIFDEFEILKVAVFVLSEIIKHLVLETSDDLITLFHFDIKLQVELESIFEHFITEREKLNKKKIEKLLSTKKVSPFATPRRTSTRHREHLTESSSTPKEDIFTNSPLKTYFESPVFKKEGVWMKEKVKYYEKTLAEGDEQVSDLECKITKLENDLKIKEKDLKCLQKKFDEKEDENQILLREIESSKVQQESLSKEVTRWKRDCELLKFRTTELSNQIEELQKIVIKEEEPNCVKRRSSSQLHGNSLLNSKEEEITLLKEKVKNLETKNYAYQRELANKILSELKEKESSGVQNTSYEEVWYMKDLDRIEREELLSTIILADNKDLSAKLNISQFENQRLLKEIENLKKKLTGKKRNSGSPELKDTTETEKFRKTFNENSFILNNSDYLIPCEQSVIFSEPEPLPCSSKSSGAVLWKTYYSPKSETENTYNINLNHNSVIPENSNLDMINDLQLSNIKIENIESDSLLNRENIESDSLLNRENNYVLGNLNFNNFFKELKKLTTNGSFQKVLQLFGMRQKEMSGTNGCNQLDFQAMLQMITDCVCKVAALNAEALPGDKVNKCCSTDDKELCTVIELNTELDSLKSQLSAASQKHEIDLKALKSELQKLKQEKIKLENKYQTSAQVISEKKRVFEEMHRKYREQILKIESLNRKYFELKKSYEGLLNDNKQQQVYTTEIRKISLNVCKKKRHYEKLHKLSQEEIFKVRAELQKLKEENENLLKEKEAWSVRSVSFLRDSLPSRDSCMSLPNHVPTKSEFLCSTYQDSNESVLSGVFHKSISHYVSENEDDFCYYNSLNPIKKEYDDERVEEIKRRNSLYPRQLQSSYPLEADLNATYHSLYVQDKCREQQQHSKKLKLGDVITEEPSLFATPISKPKKKLETPLSFQRLMKRVKCKRISIKPNGSS